MPATTTPPRRKKLIEVALPLEAINTASAREKSIRHGHPSTLHLWWARRPLAACRAVLFASLVDDPDSEPRYRKADGSVDEDLAGGKRAELFTLIEDLVLWENSNNPAVLNRARAEIARCVLSRKIETGEMSKDTVVFGKDEGKPSPKGPISFKKDGPVTAYDVELMQAPPEAVNQVLATYAPPVLDPFAGGGSIPLEAQRLGLRAHASDLNPVPVLINKALIEIPPKFANQPPVHPDVDQQTGWSGAAGLAEDVRRYGQWMRDEAEKRIGHLYPKVKITAEMVKERPDLEQYEGEELTVIAWLWARTVPSPDPSLAGKHVPLVRSFWLSKKKGREAYIRPEINSENGTYQFNVLTGKPKTDFDPSVGTVSRQGGRCLITGSPMPLAEIRISAKSGNMRETLMCVVCEGHRERLYLKPDQVQHDIAFNAKAKWKPSGTLPLKHRNFQTPAYGMTEIGDLFTNRQLEALGLFSDLVIDIRSHVMRDATLANFNLTEEYANAVAMYLAFSVSKAAMRNCSMAIWEPGMGRLAGALGRQAIPMQWSYAETNPFAGAGGDIAGTAVSVSEVLDKLVVGWQGNVKQRSATESLIADLPVISTDPPYYDNIAYADLSDFFYVWLRRCLQESEPELLRTLLTPKAEEIIASPHRHNGDKQAAASFFESALGDAIGQWRKATSVDYPLTIIYAFKQAENDDSGTASTGWETFLAGVIEHGFSITATWPVRSEATNSLKRDMNALASSIVLACVPRNEDAPIANRREFADALRAELPAAVRHMQLSNIAPVDLAQAAIGPGMAVFSRYAKVVNPDGSAFTVREALQLINEVLDEALREQEGDYDPWTRWAVAWFEQYGVDKGPFGTAEVLSVAKGVSVKGVEEAGICTSARGDVRLLKRDELPADWDPAKDDKLTIWEVTQHLIKRLETGGLEAAGALLKQVGAGHGEAARELAYRLYAVAERKKWATEARGYNELIVSWQEIEAASHNAPDPEPVETQSEMFE
jgi:putative DNA methylase